MNKLNIHQQVTNSIVAAIEAGARNWQMPWYRSGEGLNRPVNIDTGNPYQGVNIVALWAAAQQRDFSSGTWGTYRQWLKNDAQVRKGEKASLVVFYKEIDVADDGSEADEPATSRRLMARASCVFNADQVDGYEASLPEPRDPVQIIETAERFVSATAADVRHGGNRAFYRPSDDFIQIPDKDRFIGSATSTATEAYYGTLLHETVHWAGAPNRCDRQFGQRFGDDAYAMEELVAELGAAFLCADLGVTQTPREDHAAYLGHWLKVLKADNKAIFTAASKASQAATFLQSLQPASPAKRAAA